MLKIEANIMYIYTYASNEKTYENQHVKTTLDLWVIENVRKIKNNFIQKKMRAL